MLDMGFLPDIRRVLKHLPPPAKRQTLFFSATMPPPIAQLSKEMLKSPATINIERRSAPAVGITQAVYPVPQHLKPALLLHLLKGADMHDALVFTRTKHRANRLAKYLGDHGIKVERIHGNRSQSQRTEALAGFKSGKYRVLVATDIAARGIDVTALGHVVNFDVPHVPEDYIHRVGRTARAEATGSAFTLVSSEEEERPARDREGDRGAAAARDAARFRLQRASRRRTSTSGRRGRRGSAQPSARPGSWAPTVRGRATDRAVLADPRRAGRSNGAGPADRDGGHDRAGVSGVASGRAESGGALRAPRRGRHRAAAMAVRGARPTPTRSKRSSTRRSGPACGAKKSTCRRSRSRSCRRKRRAHPLLFERPLPLSPDSLVKVAPAVERAGIHLGVWRNGEGYLRLGHGARDSVALDRRRSRGAGTAGGEAPPRRRLGKVRQRRGARRRPDQARRRAGVEPARLSAAARPRCSDSIRRRRGRRASTR